MNDSKVVKPAAKRKPPNAGKGRVKGVPNKTTADIKAMILGALSDVGGQSYLAEQAHENPVAFMGLIAKVLPKEVNAEVRGSIELVLAERLKAARARLK